MESENIGNRIAGKYLLKEVTVEPQIAREWTISQVCNLMKLLHNTVYHRAKTDQV